MLYSLPVAESLVDEVSAWLERGGYILEMQVARKVRIRTNLVFQGYHYTDPVTGKERESDVGAFIILDSLEGHTHALSLFLECKSTTAPWIFFLGNAGGNGPWHAVRYMDSDCELCSQIEYDYSELSRRSHVAYALTEKRAKNAVDHAYEAVRQAASAVLAEYKDEPGYDGHEDPQVVSHLGIPIVVTESPLMVCSLDDFGSVRLEQTDRVQVLVQRLDLPEVDADGQMVTVVNIDGLDALLDKLEAFGKVEDGAGDGPPLT